MEPDKQYVYRIKAINEHGEVSEMSRLGPGLHPGSAGPGGADISGATDSSYTLADADIGKAISGS